MVCLAALVLVSCARKIHFEGSAIVPGAEGTVKVKKDNNNNYSINIDVVNLAEAKRLQPPKSTYMVWMQNEQSYTRLIGQLNTSSGLFSKTLKASLSTVTPYKPLRIYVTAEDNPATTYPQGPTVLTTPEL
jgi:hypothetical protein